MVKSIKFPLCVYEAIMRNMAWRETNGQKASFSQVVSEIVAKHFEISLEGVHFNKRNKRIYDSSEAEHFNTLAKRFVAQSEEGVSQPKLTLEERLARANSGLAQLGKPPITMEQLIENLKKNGENV